MALTTSDWRRGAKKGKKEGMKNDVKARES
jgi:hypothetical protein